MNVAVIGGGPGGLFFSILMKKAFPAARITVRERNRPDDTFGWGVVFSDQTLGNIAAADPESFAEIQRRFIYWQDIDTHYRGTCIRSGGHGFCGMSRQKLLLVLHDRCRELGIDLEFQCEVKSLDEVRSADLVLAADGVNSGVRTALADTFQPTIEWGRCRFAWFGTDKDLPAFTFVFQESEHGLFQVHAYPFEPGRGTWIVECHEDVWRRAGLDQASEEESARFSEELFADHLGGHRLLCNRSMWRSFPTIRCQQWHHENVVLMGDAVHTAHFSIGSGTKLAMEDAIALVTAFREHGTTDVPKVLRAYEAARAIDVLKTQRTAATSLAWFENSARYLRQHPLPFTFNLLTRSKQITFDNLARRDPAFMAKVTAHCAEAAGVPATAEGRAPAPMFAPLRLRGIELANRVVVSPMCQYSAIEGEVNDWHLVHLGSRGIGGAGLVLTEMTDVTPEGRITRGCAGMYAPAHAAAWRRVVDFVHRHTPAKIGIQLAHAGRKGSCSHPWSGEDQPLPPGQGWPLLAPSALPFRPGWPTPREMSRADMTAIRDAFVHASEMAAEADFDLVELHMAHGYLLSSFLSPLSNRRRDDYGGSVQKRARFPLEVFDAVRAAWPARKPLAVRISATDWLDDEGGQTIEDSIAIVRLLREHGLDLVDVSTAGNVPESAPNYGRMYQVPFAEAIRYEVNLPVMTVGAILGADHVNTILAAGRADLCALARPHLRDPYLTLHAAEDYAESSHWWPGQYVAARPRARPPE